MKSNNVPQNEGDFISVSVPKTRPVYTLKTRDNGIILLEFQDESASGKVWPYGYAGVMVHWAVLKKPPMLPEEFVNHELAAYSPYKLEFAEPERGKTVYMALSWMNSEGKTGPWSIVQSAAIPE
jgi:hypothetical protein